jgi:hypothetical protein
MFKRFISIAFISALMVGCASNGYDNYLKTNLELEVAKSNAEAERYKAMALIAQSGDTTTKVAAMMALQGSNNQTVQRANIKAPTSASDNALRWASLIVPMASQMYSIKSSADVAMNNSDNSRMVQMSTNEAFVGISKQIQSPAANYTITDSYNTTNTTNRTNTTTSGDTLTDSYNPVSGDTLTDSYNPISNLEQDPITGP